VFEGFKFEYVDVGDATLRVRHGGDGPPVYPARSSGP
jgi:haloacetate dehalogenase